MINITLCKREIRANYKIILLFLALMAMYSSVIVIMFDPTLGASLATMAESMPEMFAAFGMLNVGTTLIEFISNYLYGFILIAVPLVCIVILANRLVTKYVDSGSMAYLLASPHTRKQTITTQAICMISTILFMVIFATGLIIVVSMLSFPGALDIGGLVRINVGLFGLLFFIGSICFFGACFFNDSKSTNALGGGLSIVFILLQMISQVGEKFEFLKYATPLTLFDASGILASNTNAYIGLVVLYVLGLILYVIAIKVFCQKDLPI